MKEKIAVILALIALALGAIALVRQPEPQEVVPAEFEAALEALQAENQTLREELAALSARLDLLEVPNTALFCNLYVNEWTREEDILTLTSALVQVQLSAGESIRQAQLVLRRNGTELARADITLESGEALNFYQAALSDTWFSLPQLQEDDVLDLCPEITLENGDVLTCVPTSWHYAGGKLYTAVG